MSLNLDISNMENMRRAKKCKWGSKLVLFQCLLPKGPLINDLKRPMPHRFTNGLGLENNKRKWTELLIDFGLL